MKPIGLRIYFYSGSIDLRFDCFKAIPIHSFVLCWSSDIEYYSIINRELVDIQCQRPQSTT